MKIVLTPEEQAIFATLSKVNEERKLGLVFRAAGGWVRDKVLGRQSDDIDIALDKMTGKQFLEHLAAFGQAHPEANIGKNFTIKANVERSKHLETTCIEMHGLSIDFANLRSETYGDSRVPQIEIGTPLTDAQRRDLTINAIFFNINEGELEDLVGGLKDIETMVLRTPLGAKKSFMDDPLRVLRLLRFHSVFENSSIPGATMAGVLDKQVHDAYKQKVSPERAGPELLKLLAGPAAARSLRVLLETDLHKAVFDVPEFRVLRDLRMDQKNKFHAHNLMEHTLQVVAHLQGLMKMADFPSDLRVKMLFAALFHDFGKAHPDIPKPKPADPTQIGYKGHEDKSVEVSNAILSAIGTPADHRMFVAKVIDLHMRPHCDSWSNKSIGRFLRDCEIPGQDSKDVWRHVFIHALADEMAKGTDFAEDVQLKLNHRRQFEEFLSRPAVSVIKPILDGRMLMKMFPEIKPNKLVEGVNFIKFIGEILLEAQAEGLSATDDAVALVEKNRAIIEKTFS